MRVLMVPRIERLPLRAWGDVRGLVVHRIEVSQEDARYGDTPTEVARFFREHPVGIAATGGVMPYPLLIDARGEVTQTVPLRRVTPHARAHNPTSIGVGCIGDFRRKAPTAPQRDALVRVLAELCSWLELEPHTVRGHDELAFGSKDPDKECPGRGLPLERLRGDVAAAVGKGSRVFEFEW